MSRIRNSTPYAGVLSTTVSTRGMRSIIENYSYRMIYLSSTFTDNTGGEDVILLSQKGCKYKRDITDEQVNHDADTGKDCAAQNMDLAIYKLSQREQTWQDNTKYIITITKSTN